MVCPPQAALNSGANLVPAPQLHRARHSRAAGSCIVPFDLAENEKAVIAAALREHGHNITQAATALGLSRGALYRRLERHGL